MPTVLSASATERADRPSLAELDRRLTGESARIRRSQSVIRFFGNHRRLLTHPRFGPVARERLAAAKRRRARAQARATALRHAIAARRRAAGLPPVLPRPERTQRIARPARALTPQAVICRVFGPRCREALRVAHCESRYRTDARNGQYLGLFQMGNWARSTYGHGTSAALQAKAAYRLFVDTGRSWRPWSCKP